MTSPHRVAGEAPAGRDPGDVLDRAWSLAPGVAVRPESFGALLYHFGTRRLSFLKDRRLLAAVRGLDAAPTAREACAAAGVGAAELPAYAQALTTLAETSMIQERAVTPTAGPAGAPA